MASESAGQAPPRRSLRERLRTRIAHRMFLLYRAMTLGVRVVATDEAGAVLLVRHGYVAGWHLPGGGVDLDESCEAAAARELREETHCELAGPLVLHGIFFNASVSRRDHVAVYVAQRVKSLGPRAPDREILEARFFPRDALPAGLTRGTRARLEEIFDGRPVSPLW